ncbi:MAG TPA: D-glucuronyl C5-epimerase family protein, partial [Gaiellaceae bacterium]|nr:D-glucuronyl C5-epimerase family protein [Gaiellaceae bacterium]
ARTGLMNDARHAFAAISPKLLMALPEGPWVRLYSFNDSVVLNAQLQAVLSVHQYATLAHDPHARELSSALAQSSQRLLPRFDTGSWSRYELAGGDSPIAYHQYVTSLLWKLARIFGGGIWERQAKRFRVDWREPPAISVQPPRRRVYVLPEKRTQASLVFTVSKPAVLTVRVGNVSVTASRPAGRHVLLWRPGAHTRRAVRARISAVDRVGNRGLASSRPIQVRRDTTPPVVKAQLVGHLLFWRAHDRLSGLSNSGAQTVLAPSWFLFADASGNTSYLRLPGAPGVAPWPRGLPAHRPPAREALSWVR